MDWLSAAVFLVLCTLRTVEAEACDSNPCQAGGTCSEDAGQVTCTCVLGNTGEFCESGPDDGYWFQLPEAKEGFWLELPETLSYKWYYRSPLNADFDKTQELADLHCRNSFGGRLALPKSDDLAEKLKEALANDLFTARNRDVFFVGLLRHTDRTREDGLTRYEDDNWRWFDGEVDNVHLWSNNNEPGGSAAAAVIKATSQIGHFAARKYWYLGRFLCEKENDCLTEENRLNFGYCSVNSTTGGLIRCSYGLYGNRCEHHNYCVSNPCGEGGTCVPGVGQMRCECDSDHAGDFCEVGINEGFWLKVSANISTKLYYGSPLGTDHRKYWNDSKQACIDMGMTLAQLPTEELNYAVSHAIDFDLGNTLSGVFWIGFSKDSDNVWRWCCGETDNSYADWLNPGEIDHVDNNRAFLYCKHAVVGDGYWKAREGTNPYRYLCEKEDMCLGSTIYCQNFGTCEMSYKYGRRCLCKSGFWGDTCEHVDHCTSNPCGATGTCVREVGQFRCDCAEGYAGDLCEIGPDDELWFKLSASVSDKVFYRSAYSDRLTWPQARGACADDDIGGYLAQASTLELHDELASAIPYSEMANGNDYAIGLYKNDGDWTWYYGAEYSFEAWSDAGEPVSSDMSYVSMNMHDARDGQNSWSGISIGDTRRYLCERNDLCASGDLQCQNGGTCDKICQCAEGYTGETCEDDLDECAAGNEAHMKCVDGHYSSCVNSAPGYRCECITTRGRPGWKGDRCEIRLSECECNPCYGGAICLDDVDNIICQCPPNLTGTYCENDVNECDIRGICDGHGCTNIQGSYRCNCPSGFSGKFCKTRIHPCQEDPYLPYCN